MNAADIKKGAFTIFADKGYEATSMKDIAQAVGIQKASLYFHFESKASLFLGILDDEAKEQRRQIARFFGDVKSEETESLLKGFFVESVSYYCRKEKLLFWKRVRLMRLAPVDAEMGGPINKALDETENLIRSGLELILKKNLDEPKIKQILIHFNLLLSGFMDQMLLQDTIAKDASFYWSIFWNGAKIC